MSKKFLFFLFFFQLGRNFVKTKCLKTFVSSVTFPSLKAIVAAIINHGLVVSCFTFLPYSSVWSFWSPFLNLALLFVYIYVYSRLQFCAFCNFRFCLTSTECYNYINLIWFNLSYFKKLINCKKVTYFVDWIVNRPRLETNSTKLEFCLK